MQEAKARLVSLQAVLNSKIGLRAIAVQDFGYIQLRMLCELIALSCVIAHGDLTVTKAKLRNEWRAGRIINELGKVHPDFFPRAASLELKKSKLVKITVRKAGDPISKDELRCLSSTCGDNLHRGDITDLDNRSEQSLGTSLREIVQWTNALTELLSVHVISLSDRKTKYLCLLDGKGGRVSLTPMERVEQT